MGVSDEKVDFGNYLEKTENSIGFSEFFFKNIPTRSVRLSTFFRVGPGYVTPCVESVLMDLFSSREGVVERRKKVDRVCWKGGCMRELTLFL